MLQLRLFDLHFFLNKQIIQTYQCSQTGQVTKLFPTGADDELHPKKIQAINNLA
jgi:hypothetical protein